MKNITLKDNMNKLFLIILGLMFIGSMNKYLTYFSMICVFWVGILIAIKSLKIKSYVVPFWVIILLCFQNLMIGLGAHFTSNTDSSLMLMTQVPFITIFLIWSINFICDRKKNTTKKIFYLYLIILLLSIFIGRGTIESIAINLRNLTVFYMVYEIGFNNIVSKKNLDIFINKILKLSSFILVVGIILYIGGYDLYEKIGIGEVYLAKIGFKIDYLDNRFYTTLISNRVMRMGSIFYEPVNLAYFYSCTFIISLFYKSKRKLVYVLLNGLGLLLTFGKGGYLLSIMVVGYVILNKLLKKLFSNIDINDLSNFSILIIFICTICFSIYYYLNIGAAATPHFVGITNTFNSIMMKPIGYGLGTGGNMAMHFGSSNDWMSSGGETAFMSFFYQIGVQGIVILVVLFIKLCLTKINYKMFNTDFLLVFKILPLALLGISILQDNTFTPQCISLFMLFQGGVKKITNDNYNEMEKNKI